jgi:hypothetical protein
MGSWFQTAQLAFALLISLVIMERVRALYWHLATSEESLRWLLRQLRESKRPLVQAWSRERPESQAARLIQAAEDDPDTRELLLELRDEASSRLRLLRVAATLASTMGLLGGILTLTHVTMPDAGLLALQAGAVERLVMQQAVATMAIGVGTSAVCFQALALLRPAAQRLIIQAQQLSSALS